jgi:hypothetical protein
VYVCDVHVSPWILTSYQLEDSPAPSGTLDTRRKRVSERGTSTQALRHTEKSSNDATHRNDFNQAIQILSPGSPRTHDLREAVMLLGKEVEMLETQGSSHDSLVQISSNSQIIQLPTH